MPTPSSSSEMTKRRAGSGTGSHRHCTCGDHRIMSDGWVGPPRRLRGDRQQKDGATRADRLGTPRAMHRYKSGTSIHRSHTHCTALTHWKMLFPIVTVLLGLFVGSLQGKPTDANVETKAGTPIEATRNEIKETQRTEIGETPRNGIKGISRNEFNEAPINECRERQIFKGENIREITSAMDFLNTQIREFSEKAKDRQEEFKGIIEARNRLETAIKPLHGVMLSDMAASSLETAMTNSVNIARQALEDLPVKQVQQMEQIVEESKAKTVEEQERALREYAEKHGENVKKAVDQVFAAKEKADFALESYLRNHGENLSQEARKANEQMLIVMKDKKLNSEGMVHKLEEFVNTLSDSVRGELNVRNMAELKQLVNTYTGLTPVLHRGIQGI